jgi:hypothetical protein
MDYERETWQHKVAISNRLVLEFIQDIQVKAQLNLVRTFAILRLDSIELAI